MWRRSCVLALAVAAGAAGCGGDGMSEDDYRAEARKICDEAEQRTDRIPQPERGSTESAGNYLRQVSDVTRSYLERFEKLDPPDDLQDAHDQFVQATRDGLRVVDRLARDLRASPGEVTGIVFARAQREIERAERQNDAAARDLGVPECAD